MEPLITRLVAASVCISYRAGKVVRDIMSKGELGIVTKGKNDFQTEADRSAQRCILASLHALFPKVSIFGEEEEDPRPVPQDWVETTLSEDVLKTVGNKLPDNLKAVKDEDICVWVDPLDGTAEYTQGLLDHVTVLIGIAVKGRAMAGVVYQPYYNYEAGPDAKLGRVIWGIIGVGTYGYQKNTPPDESHIITTTRSHGTGVVARAIDAMQDVKPLDILRVGGAGHKVLLILEGKAHAYVFASPGCKKWDTCAPEAILHAAGGKLTDMHGNDITYEATVQRRNTGGVLCTPLAEQHKWYADRVPADVLEALPV